MICLPISVKTIKTAPKCDQKYNRDPNMSIGLIITISTQKVLKTYKKIGFKIALFGH